MAGHEAVATLREASPAERPRIIALALDRFTKEQRPEDLEAVVRHGLSFFFLSLSLSLS